MSNKHRCSKQTNGESDGGEIWYYEAQETWVHGFDSGECTFIQSCPYCGQYLYTINGAVAYYLNRLSYTA